MFLWKALFDKRVRAMVIFEGLPRKQDKNLLTSEEDIGSVPGLGKIHAMRQLSLAQLSSLYP